MKSNSIKDVVTNIILIILAIVFVILGGIFLTEMHNTTNEYIKSADSFIYDIQAESFSYMIDQVYENRIKGAKETAQMKEVYGVADYFQAASLYKAYAKDGDTQKAKTYQDKMDAAKEAMGELSYISEDINTMLEIE